MGAGDVAVGGQIGVHEGQDGGGAGGVAPVAHQVHDDAEHAHEDDAGALHAAVGVRGQFLRERAAGLRVGEDGVAFGAEREREVERA